MRFSTIAREICHLAGFLDVSERSILVLNNREYCEKALDRRRRAMSCLEAAVSGMRDFLHLSIDDEIELDQHLQRLGPYLNLLPEMLLHRVLEEGTCDDRASATSVRGACSALKRAFDACNTTLAFDGWSKDEDSGCVQFIVLNSRRIQKLRVPLYFKWTATALECAAASMSGLKTLQLGVDEGSNIALMAGALERLTTLHTLEMKLQCKEGNCDWCVKTMQWLAPAVRAMSLLVHFTIDMSGYVFLPLEASYALTALLRGLPRQLESLGIFYVHVDAAQLEAALIQLQALRLFKLCAHWTTDLTNFPAVLEQLAHIVSVEVILMNHHGAAPVVEGAQEPDVRLSPARLLHSLRRPANLHQLTRVEVTGNPLLDDLQDLPDALRGLPGLAEVRLRHLLLGPVAAAALAPALASLTRVTCLDLDGNNIGEDGAAALAPALRALPGLLKLRLSMNGIGAAGAAALAPALWAGRIEHLSVCFNGMGDAGVWRLDPSRMGHLKTIDMRCNGLTAVGLAAVVGPLAARSVSHIGHVLASRPGDLTADGEDNLDDMLPCLELPPRKAADQDIYMRDLCNNWGAVNEDVFYEDEAEDEDED